MHISPYLTFNGDCEQAFAFYADVFGVTPTVLMQFKDFPGPKRTPEYYDERGRACPDRHWRRAVDGLRPA